MAEPIPFPPPPRDPRAALIRQLENAPMDHAEALLDAYAILQLLRDKGLLEIAKGALGSGEKILRAVRNLVILGKIAGSLDPVVLEKIVAAVSGSVSEARTQKPPGLLHLLGTLAGPDSRRALGPIVTALASLGATLDESKNPPAGLPKKTVTRHTVID
jgi:uncharacterized protein YjgD (DUF1641 family)